MFQLVVLPCFDLGPTVSMYSDNRMTVASEELWLSDIVMHAVHPRRRGGGRTL